MNAVDYWYQKYVKERTKNEKLRNKIKDLPKWKPLPLSEVSHATNDVGISILRSPSASSTYSTANVVLYKGDYYIPIYELDKLERSDS